MGEGLALLNMFRPYLQLHVLVLILAVTAILGKLIALPAPALVLWRTGLAALGLVLWQTIRKQPSLKIATSNARSDTFKALGVGIILGAHWMTFFGSIQLSSVSICLAGMATTSFFTALTEPLINKSRLKWSDLMLGVMVIPGLLLIIEHAWAVPLREAVVDAGGILLGKQWIGAQDLVARGAALAAEAEAGM